MGDEFNRDSGIRPPEMGVEKTDTAQPEEQNGIDSGLDSHVERVPMQDEAVSTFDSGATTDDFASADDLSLKSDADTTSIHIPIQLEAPVSELYNGDASQNTDNGSAGEALSLNSDADVNSITRSTPVDAPPADADFAQAERSLSTAAGDEAAKQAAGIPRLSQDSNNAGTREPGSALPLDVQSDGQASDSDEPPAREPMGKRTAILPAFVVNNMQLAKDTCVGF
jgi:hypothetical protein